MDAPVWDVTVFTKNRQRLLAGDVAVSLLLAVMRDPSVKRLLSTEHFLVDRTLIDVWASMKSFRPRTAGMTRQPGRVAMPSETSMARSAATRHMPRRSTPTPGSSISRPGSHRGSASWGTC
jgi:hypothetical protein